MFGETAARRKEKERVISDQFADRPNFMHSAGGKELAFARPLTALLQASVHSQQSSCFESASAAVKQHASTPCDGTCHLHMGEYTDGFGYKYS